MRSCWTGTPIPPATSSSRSRLERAAHPLETDSPNCCFARSFASACSASRASPKTFTKTRSPSASKQIHARCSSRGRRVAAAASWLQPESRRIERYTASRSAFSRGSSNDVEVHVVHHVGEAEPCVGIGEAERAAGARRAEGAPARAQVELRSRSEEAERHPAGHAHHLVPRTLDVVDRGEARERRRSDAELRSSFRERRIGPRDRARRPDAVARRDLDLERSVDRSRSMSAKSIDFRSSDHGHRIRITNPLGTDGSARMARIGSEEPQLREPLVGNLRREPDVELDLQRLRDLLVEEPAERAVRRVDVADQLLHVEPDRHRVVAVSRPRLPRRLLPREHPSDVGRGRAGPRAAAARRSRPTPLRD